MVDVKTLPSSNLPEVTLFSQTDVWPYEVCATTLGLALGDPGK